MNTEEAGTLQLLEADHRTMPEAQLLIPLADRLIAHTFRLLGSEWTTVRYGMQAPGFEGTNYSDPNVTASSVIAQLPEQKRVLGRELLDLAARLVPQYEPIDWFIDFKSGYRYPIDHFRNLAYGLVQHVDAKVPYDLSRHYHFVQLALAWRLTGKDKYRKEILAQMVDWIAMNPYEYGIGWHYNMNVAIRAVNWIVALSLIDEGSDQACADEARARNLIEDSLLQHRRYIGANLEFPETDFHPNHYIANLGGLLMTSHYFMEKDADSIGWKIMAIREIRLEIDRQFGADGFNFESATSYHAFSLEMLVYPLILTAKGSGCRSPADVRSWMEDQLTSARMDKIRRAFAALRDITQPHGLIPLIGDADAGRFLYLENPGIEVRDWKFLCCVGATLFQDAELLPAGTTEADGAAANMLLGFAVTASVYSPGGAQYPDAGFYVMKDESFFCLMFAGPIGTAGKGGHAHDDKLSFVLSLDGTELLVDPGVYVYTASRAYRSQYRSAEAHNTVCISGEPQNRPLPQSFWWGCRDDTHCRVLKWEDGPEKSMLVGQHAGYTRLNPPLVHERSFEWLKRERTFIVTDTFEAVHSEADGGWQGEGTERPPMVATFMLHPDCQMMLERPDTAVVSSNGKTLKLHTDHGRWELRSGLFSPSYGIKEQTIRLAAIFDKGFVRNVITIKW